MGLRRSVLADSATLPPARGRVRGARKVLIPDASRFPQLDNAPASSAAVADFLER